MRFLQDIGAPKETLLLRSEILPEWLSNPEHPIPLLSCYYFLDLMARKEGGYSAAIHAATYSRLEDLGSYGQQLAKCQTVYEFIVQGTALYNTFTSGERLWLEDRPNTVRIHHSGFSNASHRNIGSNIFSLASSIMTLRLAMGHNWCPTEIGLPTLKVAKDLALFAPNSEPKLTESGAFYSICKSDLIKPYASQELNEADCEGNKKEEPFHALPLKTDPLESIQQYLEISLPQGYPSINQTAAAIGISPRTLQRQLQAHNLQYAGLVDTVRMALAREWLQRTDKPISAISQALAYTKPSNFTRAFRRVNGVSPREYRLFRQETVL